MQSPPIAIKRRRGWTRAGWNDHRPILEKAATRAHLSLEDMGVTYERPKVGQAWGFEHGGMPDDIIGCAYDEKNFALFLEMASDGKLRKVYKTAKWSCTILHEVVHCARFERFDRGDFVELAATEGLAHLAERHHILKYCGKQVVENIFDFDLEQPDPALGRGFQAIVKGAHDREVHAEWFDGRKANPFVRDGSLYGSQLVYQQMQRGYALADLMNQPAEDVLGL